MNKWRLFLIALLGVFTLSVSAAPEEKTQKAPKTKEKTIKVEEPKRVYMYGVSVNFNDSTVYLTDVQRLDDVIINAEGAIKNHSGYSLQLKVYLEGTLGKVNQTCAVIYSDKKKKLERRFIKTKKKYIADKDKILHQIGASDFTFQKQ